MTNGVENIGHRDIVWSFFSTFIMVAAGVILLPFILHHMPAETVGIWNIFQTITFLVLLLDFGFRPSFARNITYIFSGVQSLQQEGVQTADTSVNYALLKGTLQAMKSFYRWMAVCIFLLLASVGSVYIHYILNKYNGDCQDAYFAWILLILVNCYNLYTFYYDALLTGKGYIRQLQQIVIIGQIVYLAVAITFIYLGFGLTAIVSAQVLNTVIKRVLMKRVFFTKELKKHLQDTTAVDTKSIMQATTPNAIKMGLTSIGGFLVNKSSMLIGGAMLSLEQIASFGITIQVMDILARCATIVYQVYTPRLAQCRAEHNIHDLRHYFHLNCISVLAIFIIGGLLWCLLGDWALTIIDSKTLFVSIPMLCVMLLFAYLEQNHATAAGFLLADNKVPFFIPSILSGLGTIVLMVIFLVPCHMEVWGLILAPGLAQLCYQNWKWPLEVIKEIRQTDPC